MQGLGKVSNLIGTFLGTLAVAAYVFSCPVLAGDEGESAQKNVTAPATGSRIGGGYAVTGQIRDAGYAMQLYDATNGLPTSDANYVMGSKEGYIWIGNYNGVIRYDGTAFDQINYSDGLTSARAIFEDSHGRIWVGTNDNGVVVIDAAGTTWITNKDGLPSSSIRNFAEDGDGYVYIGTTSGLCYADPQFEIHILDDTRLNEERILRLDSDSSGTIYGQTKNGVVFSVKKRQIYAFYKNGDLGNENRISGILADPNVEGNVYIGTEGSEVYYGPFGETVDKLRLTSVAPLKDIHWLNYDCDRVWVSSSSQVGYIDDSGSFRLLTDLPVNSGIEMVTSDYQGNMWIASSTQGVMKIVTSNFVDLSLRTQLPREVTNSTCLVRSALYVGTENGIRILREDSITIDNQLTSYLSGTRIRALMRDDRNNLWIATFDNKKGLVSYGNDGQIKGYTVEDGMPSNEIRCIIQASDGSIVAGTNNGMARIKDGEVVKTVDKIAGLKNTVFLDVAELHDGTILAATDGDGIYEISEAGTTRIGRDDGLTSDVVMRIKNDPDRDLVWVITSNSIEYIKDGVINEVTTFPYNNNYDMFFDGDSMWVLSSNGLYVVSVKEALADNITEYRMYTMVNGLTSTPTAHSRCEFDSDGNLYIAGRMGVCKVNLESFFEENVHLNAGVKSVYSGDKMVLPDTHGNYILPSDGKRIRISVAVLDYSLSDPMVRIYMEGDEDDQLLVHRSEIPDLEYTGMKHGDYKLHIEVLDRNKRDVVLESVCSITKKPTILELFVVRVMLVIMVALFGGFLVWRFMKNTVIRKQYDEISKARDDAERANSAKTRFLANISHEIRTPINTIMGMDEMIMREDATGVPQGYFLSMMNYAFDIRNASETLLGLINDLLDISKIESGKMHLVEQEYDVQDLLRSIVSMIRVKSTEKELMFDVVVDEIIPGKLYGDAGKIKQIVLNLLTNAVKYTGKGGVILSVSLDERVDDTAGISFSVKDTGIGVKEEDMDKLFTAYERLDEQRNSGIQGTGLGLDISRRFAELLGGSLTCESVYGEGSEFTLSLKQKITDPTPIGVFLEHEETAAKGPYVPQFVAPDADVLVVDDNPMNLNVIKGLLKATRIFVTTASSGEDCLEKMKTTRFNIVLLDHMMPGMDGIETVGHIRETDPDIPVYALTANTTAGEDFYVSKGFTGYLAKPIDSFSLEKTIKKHLPREIMFEPERGDMVAELDSIPDEMSWIYDVKEIDTEEGVRNSGGVSQFIFSLKLFYDTVDGNSKVIRDAYDAGDVRLYTIKVHALKSSLRIIGAKELSQLAASLEEAGNKDNLEFIDIYTDELLTSYADLKQKLSGISKGDSSEDASEKEEIPEEELRDAYSALKDVIPQMDYDSVEMILGQLSEYRLPDKDKEVVKELSDLLRSFDWGKMEELIDKQG